MQSGSGVAREWCFCGCWAFVEFSSKWLEGREAEVEDVVRVELCSCCAVLFWFGRLCSYLLP